MKSEGLQALLMPGDPELTKSLVRASGVRRLREFINLSQYLASLPHLTHFRDTIEETLQEMELMGESTLDRRLSSPQFRGWLARFGGVKEFGPNDVALARQLEFWPNMRFSFTHDVEFRDLFAVENGVCASWDCMLAFNTPDVSAAFVEKVDSEISVSDAEDNTNECILKCRLGSGGQIETLIAKGNCQVLTTPTFPELNIAIRNDLPLLHLKLSNTAQRDTGVAFGELDHSGASYPAFDMEEFLAAATLIQSAWPAEYSDFAETMHVFVPRGIPDGMRARGMTVSSYQGAAWLMARGIVPLIEHMVHEQGHVKLRYIEESVPILTEDQTDERFAVGWRRDPRPIVGIYEGIYVHMHSLMALIGVAEKNLLDAELQGICDKQINQLQDELSEGLEILEEHGRFTTAGSGMIDWAHRCLATPARAWSQSESIAMT